MLLRKDRPNSEGHLVQTSFPEDCPSLSQGLHFEALGGRDGGREQLRERETLLYEQCLNNVL